MCFLCSFKGNTWWQSTCSSHVNWLHSQRFVPSHTVLKQNHVPSNYSNLFFFCVDCKVWATPCSSMQSFNWDGSTHRWIKILYDVLYIFNFSHFNVLMWIVDSVEIYSVCILQNVWKNSCTKKRTQHLWASWQFEPLNIMYWNWNFNLISFFVHSTCTILLRYCFSGLSDILSRQCFVSQRRDRRLRAKNLN